MGNFIGATGGVALLMFIVAGIATWWALILIRSPNYNDVIARPTKKQSIGVVFAFIIAISIWGRDLYVVRGEKS